jgi:hypothetical protein
MKNLKNFDAKEDFLLEQEKPLYNTILHNEDEVYIQPTMATYVCDGETSCITLSEYKSQFSSFICNGVELIKTTETVDENTPSTYSDVNQDERLVYCNNDVEHIEEQIQYDYLYMTNRFYMLMGEPYIVFSFNRKLIEGESIVIMSEDGKFIFVVGDDKFNDCISYNENNGKYTIDYNCLFMPKSRGLSIPIILYGCTNSDGKLYSENDYITTIVDVFDSYVNGEPTFVETEITLQEKMQFFNNGIDMQKASNLVIDFGRIIDETDIISMLIIQNDIIVYETNISYDEFIEVFQLIEGTTKYIAINTIQTYQAIDNISMLLSFALISTNEDGTENINYDFKYSYDLIKPFPKGYELKCYFKLHDDTMRERIFSECHDLKSVDLRSYKNLKIGNVASMFYYCSNLESVKLGEVEFVENGKSNFYNMFIYCQNLKSVDLTYFMKNIQPYHTYFTSMFSNCSNLQMIKMMGDVSNVTNLYYMFDGIPNKGIFYCDNRYDYSKIIELLPEGWEVYKI